MGGVRTVYLYLGQTVMVPWENIVGIFDLDNTTWSHRTRKLLDRAQQEGRVVSVGSDLPRCFVLCRDGAGQEVVYLCQFNTATLARRAKSNPWTGLDSPGKSE